MSLKGQKVHAVEDHLVYLMILWNRIRCFLKDFVEQSHQTRKLEEKRSGHIGDPRQAALSLPKMTGKKKKKSAYS